MALANTFLIRDGSVVAIRASIPHPIAVISFLQLNLLREFLRIVERWMRFTGRPRDGVGDPPTSGNPNQWDGGGLKTDGNEPLASCWATA